MILELSILPWATASMKMSVQGVGSDREEEKRRGQRREERGQRGEMRLKKKKKQREEIWYNQSQIWIKLQPLMLKVTQ